MNNYINQISDKKIPTVEDLINDPNFNINNWYGYVYITLNKENGRSYIGKKNFFLTQNKKIGKKELKELPIKRGKKPQKKKITKESDWKTYYGSALEVKNTNPANMVRYVIKLCKNSKELTYYETKELFNHNVLENQNVWINSNILGKFFPKDL